MVSLLKSLSLPSREYKVRVESVGTSMKGKKKQPALRAYLTLWRGRCRDIVLTKINQKGKVSLEVLNLGIANTVVKKHQ
jgi:hypothetical protein